MTQEQALAIARELMPDAEIQLERVHCIGAKRGRMDEFKIFDWNGKLTIEASSDISWEHCIAILRTKVESQWAQDNSPVEEEAAR